MDPAKSYTHDSTLQLRSLGELLAISLAERQPLRAFWIDADVQQDLYIVGGEVVHARYGELEGSTAVYRMLDEPTHHYSIEIGAVAPRRSVFASWSRLCHAARCELLDAPRAISG